MKTICIAGTRSGAGKTAVAEMLLRSLKGWTAVKISVSHVRFEGGRKTLETHGLADRPFEIVTRLRLLREPGSDTARCLAAGARRVVWLRTKRRALRKAVRALLERLKSEGKLLVEGNSFALATKPDLTILVAPAGESSLKPSARAILPKTDIVLVQAGPAASAERAGRLRDCWRKRTPRAGIFVTRSLRRENRRFVSEVSRRVRNRTGDSPC